MKKLIAGLISAILFTAAAQAGLGPSTGDLEVTDLGEGFTLVEGTMVSVRFTDDDVQLIGCRIRGNRGGGAASVVCRARDINEIIYTCFSFDPALIEAGKSLSPFSYVRFVFDATGECDSLLVSTRSFHIPDAGSEKGKSK